MKTLFQFLNSSEDGVPVSQFLCFGSAHSTLHHFVIIFCVALVSQFESTKPSGICKMLQIYPIILSTGLTGTHQQKIAGKKIAPASLRLIPAVAVLATNSVKLPKLLMALMIGDGMSIKG